MTPAKRRQYGTGSITQRKSDGLWIGRFDAGWTENDTRRRITVSAKTKSECAAKLKERIRQHEAGRSADVDPRKTVRAWADEWLPMREKKLRPTTYTTDAGAVRKWIIPTLGHRRLHELAPADLRALEAAIRNPDQPGGARTSTTALHAHKTLLSMLKAAVVEGHHIAPGIFKADKPSKALHDRTEIPLDGALRMLKVISQRDDADRWMSAMLNGMRQGESLGLTWDCIDLDMRQIDVSWQLQTLPYRIDGDPTSGFRVPDRFEARHLTASFHLTRPKTAHGTRILPIVPWMARALERRKAAWEPNPWGLVWTSPTGRPIRDEDDRAQWYAIQDAADVRHPSGRHYYLHETRHTVVSLLMRAKVPRYEIEAIVGHAALVATYVHIDDTQTRAALETLAETFQLEG